MGPWLDRAKSGKLDHRVWSEKDAERLVFSYPADTDAIIATILDYSAAGADAYVCTSLMRSATSREKGDQACLWSLHADVDDEIDLDEVRALGGCAVSSGTPGHLHVYVPLAHEVSLAEWEVLEDDLIERLGADDKKAPNDLLRPPGTWNYKPTIDNGDATPAGWAV